MKYLEGQKVVCVNAMMHGGGSPERLVLNQVYTVERLSVNTIILLETLASSDSGKKYKWSIDRFRLATPEEILAASSTTLAEPEEEYF